MMTENTPIVYSKYSSFIHNFQMTYKKDNYKIAYIIDCLKYIEFSMCEPA